MKNSLIVFIFSVIVSACSSSSEKVEDAKTDVVEENKELDEANAEYVDDIEKYRNETDKKIEANEVIIKDLKAKITRQKKDAQVEYKQKVAE